MLDTVGSILSRFVAGRSWLVFLSPERISPDELLVDSFLLHSVVKGFQRIERDGGVL